MIANKLNKLKVSKKYNWIGKNLKCYTFHKQIYQQMNNFFLTCWLQTRSSNLSPTHLVALKSSSAMQVLSLPWTPVPHDLLHGSHMVHSPKYGHAWFVCWKLWFLMCLSKIKIKTNLSSFLSFVLSVSFSTKSQCYILHDKNFVLLFR